MHLFQCCPLMFILCFFNFFYAGTRENLLVSHTNSTSIEWQPTVNKGQEINLPRNTRSQRLPSTSSQLSLSQASAGGDNSVTNQHPEVEEEVSTGKCGFFDS